MKSRNKIKALCYFDNDKGRDVEILIPLIFFCEEYLDISVEPAFIFDIDKIRRVKPQIVFLANTIGSKYHHQIAKYAFKSNILVFALVSEGNFRTNGTFNYWGFNKDKVFYQKYIALWSQRTVDFLRNELPEIKDRIVLTGATGFDRYKIYKFESKEDFLARYNLKHFKKVIGYAGWAFGKLHNPNGLLEIKQTHKQNAEARIKWMTEQQGLIEDILRSTIEANPDILFILKRHPNEIHPHLTQKDNNEMINLIEYPNVLYIRNEEDIHTLINVSDIWLAFESTTVIEAWMMKKIPTIFINPDPDFVRDSNYKGTIICKSFNELQSLINEYYQTGYIKRMDDKRLIDARRKIIRDVIGFADGFNHVRAGLYVQKSINEVKSIHSIHTRFITIYFLRYILVKLGKVFYNRKLFLLLPKFKKTVWIFEKQDLTNLNSLKKTYYKYLRAFHNEHDIKHKINTTSFQRELWNES